MTLDTIVDVQVIPIEEDDEKIFEVVSDEYRTITRTGFKHDALTNALEQGLTLKVKKEFRIDRLYRWASANHYKLHRRAFPDFAVIWLDMLD